MSFYRKSNIESKIRDKFPEEIEKLHLFETPNGTLEINLIKIYPSFRNQGIASEILEIIVDYANATNKIIHLTPTDEFGSDKKELTNFYARFGFVKNAGKYKDFRIKDTMIKYPTLMNEARGFTNQELRKKAIHLLKSLGIPTDDKNILPTMDKIKDLILSTNAGVIFENQNFNNRVKTFEEFIFEAEVIDFGGQKVAIFPGRFQPAHLGHLAAFKEASRRFGVPVVPIQIFSKTDKSPIPDKVLEKMGNDMVKEFDFLAGYVLYPSTLKTAVPQMVKLLREQYGFEAIGMGCGSDRLKSYEPQIKYLNSEKSDTPVSQTFQLEMVDERIPDGPSGTKVRQAIANGDQEAFEKYMPKSLHKYFGELQKYIK
jgi:GNAT superfamily N-acetyltransferase